MSFLDGLKKFGLEVLKIGQYVIFGAQTVQGAMQAMAPQMVTGKDFLSRFIEIVKGVEVTGAAATEIAGSTALTGPQKLAAATALISNELASLHVGGAAIKDAAAYARAAQGYAQATVDYLKAFGDNAVQATANGPTTTLTPPAAPAA